MKNPMDWEKNGRRNCMGMGKQHERNERCLVHHLGFMGVTYL